METKPPQPNFGIEKMPETIYGVSLTPLQKEKLARGEQLFLENMELSGGRLVDGKVSFLESNGELNLNLLEKKPTLEIPKEISGYKLSPTEVEELKAERVVSIKLKQGTLFLQIDKDLNRVVVKTERDLGIPKEIGGYLLSDRDKNLFANHETLPPRVYLNPENNSYFLASIRRTEDGKGLEFTNYKPLEKDQAQAMIDKFNKHDRPLENIAGVTINTQPERSITTSKTTSVELYHSFEKHVQEKNFSAIKDMTDKGFKTTQDQVEQMTIKYGYSKSEKESLQASVSIGKNKKNGQELSL